MLKNLKGIESILLDFDGVFTDNFVLINEHGEESVKCSRSDGLGVSNFRKFVTDAKLRIDLTIISTEKNEVVSQRAKKIGIECHTGIIDKKVKVEELFKSDLIYANNWESVLFIGNDTNDLSCIVSSKASFAPVDAHPKVKACVDFIGERRGGDGFVRECLEYFVQNILEEKNEHFLNR